jgi:pimeloyl-ACP methyl ester carboxylesterase
MKNIYLFSGLGADHRAFQFLNLSQFNVTYIDWIRPERNESIETYALRLSQQITQHKPIFIGLSFGGMMALEVAKYVEPEKIILISSLKSRDEIPLHFKFTALLRLHKTMSPKFLQRPNRILFWFFGVENKIEKELLNSIIKDTDPKFTMWAIDKIINWKNKQAYKNVTHIHGTADRLLPHRNMRNLIRVPGGGHFMIINKAHEINQLLAQVI